MDQRRGREHFDAIIVGSGFGGSVMAYRLAQAGLKVCVLERGKEWPPGSFPRSPYAMRRNFWDPSLGLHGLFNLWSFRGLGGVVASGLGGGSLIYANVLLRKEEETFIREDPRDGSYEYWPVTRADLERHYDEVERMMGVQRYPFDKEPYSQTAKTVAMRLAAEKMGRADDWQLPPLAVTFANPGEEPVPGEPIKPGPYPNLFGRTRSTCRLCGECDIGCNYGSKNTLDYTYLSAAKHEGAELRARCEVKRFWPDEGEYVVEYLDHSDAREGEPPEVPTDMLPRTLISADRLILAAGTFGTTYLLLKNLEDFPGINRARLGSRFCGNGDLLGFLLNCKDSSSGRPVPRPLNGGHGPVITSALHIRGAEEGGSGRGYYVEDAGYPDFINWLYEGANQLALLKRALRLGSRLAKGWLRLNRDSDVSAEIAEVLGDCTDSASSLPLLAMGRDIPDGHMHLTEDGMLDIDWTTHSSKAYFQRVRETMEEIADALEGRLQHNPLGYLSRVITVHPLGGCPMGRGPGEGVVDANGEVFNHPGLYVADGSVAPGPVGPNPSLTIAALADRFADHIIEHHRRERPGHRPPKEEGPWPLGPM